METPSFYPSNSLQKWGFLRYDYLLRQESLLIFFLYITFFSFRLNFVLFCFKVCFETGSQYRAQVGWEFLVSLALPGMELSLHDCITRLKYSSILWPKALCPSLPLVRTSRTINHRQLKVKLAYKATKKKHLLQLTQFTLKSHLWLLSRMYRSWERGIC